MIRIQITPTSLSATGHAGYNPGNDIVCAAVSALVQTFEASAREFTTDDFYEGREMEYDKTVSGRRDHVEKNKNNPWKYRS